MKLRKLDLLAIGIFFGFIGSELYSHYNRNKIDNKFKNLEKEYKSNLQDHIGFYLYEKIPKDIFLERGQFNKKINDGLKEYLKEINILIPFEGHAHDSTICLSLEGAAKEEDIFHELGHVRKIGIDKANSGFSKEWGEIANFEYGEKNIKFKFNKYWEAAVWKEDSTKNLKHGLLGIYSAKSIHEDVAEFVSCLGYESSPETLKKIIKEEKDKDFYIKFLYSKYPFYFADTTDHRYQKKLNLLKKYNFLTKEEHKKLSENLGSLKYLLKAGKGK